MWYSIYPVDKFRNSRFNFIPAAKENVGNHSVFKPAPQFFDFVKVRAVWWQENKPTCTPEEAGVGIFANWTAPLACRLVEERFQVKFSERGMRDLFYRTGLSYTRPAYTLNKADPEKQDAFRQQFEDLKKTAQRGD